MANASHGFIVWREDQSALGPVDLQALVTMVQEKKVNAETWVFVPRIGVWQKAAQVEDLLIFFHSNGHATLGPTAIKDVDPRILRQLRILAGMTDEQLARFACYMELLRVPQWTMVVRQGERGDAMYLVAEGALSVRINIMGAETGLATLGTGDFFGDISLFDHGPRSATVIADTASVLLKISSSSFAELAQEAPDLATPFLLAIGKTLTARIRAGNKHHEEAVKMSRIWC